MAARTAGICPSRAMPNSSRVATTRVTSAVLAVENSAIAPISFATIAFFSACPRSATRRPTGITFAADDGAYWKTSGWVEMLCALGRGMRRFVNSRVRRGLGWRYGQRMCLGSHVGAASLWPPLPDRSKAAPIRYPRIPAEQCRTLAGSQIFGLSSGNSRTSIREPSLTGFFDQQANPEIEMLCIFTNHAVDSLAGSVRASNGIPALYRVRCRLPAYMSAEPCSLAIPTRRAISCLTCAFTTLLVGITNGFTS